MRRLRRAAVGAGTNASQVDAARHDDAVGAAVVAGEEVERPPRHARVHVDAGDDLARRTGASWPIGVPEVAATGGRGR